MLKDLFAPATMPVDVTANNTIIKNYNLRLYESIKLGSAKTFIIMFLVANIVYVILPLEISLAAKFIMLIPAVILAIWFAIILIRKKQIAPGDIRAEMHYARSRHVWCLVGTIDFMFVLGMFAVSFILEEVTVLTMLIAMMTMLILSLISVYFGIRHRRNTFVKEHSKKFAPAVVSTGIIGTASALGVLIARRMRNSYCLLMLIIVALCIFVIVAVGFVIGVMLYDNSQISVLGNEAIWRESESENVIPQSDNKKSIR